MRGLLATIALLAASVGAHAAPDQYLCIVEHAAGLHYDKQTREWAPAAFATGAKYILRRVNSRDIVEQEKKKWGLLLQRTLQRRPKADWFFSQFGEGDAPPVAVCDGSDPVFFACTTVIGARSVEFISMGLRFEIVRSGGYVAQGGLIHDAGALRELADNPNDLSFEVGKCNAF